MDIKYLPMTRIPVTVYKDDPLTRLQPAEWHELWCAYKSQNEFVLCERHGWWDGTNKRALFGVPILSEIFKTEKEVYAAFDARIERLKQEGWICGYTTTVDIRSGNPAPIRIF